MKLRASTQWTLVLVMGLVLGSGASSLAAVSVTGASGGNGLSADTAANAPAPEWTTLGAITLTEGANNDFAAGSGVTLVLKAPEGFEFNTAVSPSVSFTAGRDISSAAVAMTDATTITLTLTVSGTAAADSLTLGGTTGLQVRPSAGAPLAAGKHIYRPSAGGGTASINGITASADGSGGSNFGNLTEVVGAGVRLAVATQPSATAVVHVTFAQQPIIRIEDQFGNLRNNDTWNVTAARNGGDGELEGTTSVSAVGGVATFTDLANSTVGDITITFFSVPWLEMVTSQTTSVGPGPFVKLQVLLPGEVAAPGGGPGKTGTPDGQATGIGYTVIVNAVDADYNLISTNDTVQVTSSDPSAVLPAAAALSGGTMTFTVTNRTVGSWTFTASDVTHPGIAADTSSAVGVVTGEFVKLQILLPGETAAPGTPTGKTGTPTVRTAGTAYNVTVNAVDGNWNVVNVSDTVQITGTDPNASLPGNAALSGGTATFSVVNKTAGSWTFTATDVTQPAITASTSPAFTVNPGAFTKLQLLVPGETAAAGTLTGKTGAATAQNTDTPFNVIANAVDANWNVVSTAGDTIAITTSDPNAALPANAALSGGTQTFSVRFRTAGSRTVTATDLTDGSKTANTSPAMAVNLGAFAQLQVLLPGEAGAPGTATGKTGTPTAQTAGASFNVTVRAVDANYNLISTNDTVQITTSDANAVLPASAALSGGSGIFSVVNKTAGSWTVAATDVTHAGITTGTSAAFTVNAGAFTKLQLLVPGEGAAPGTAAGKTGTPTAQNTDASFNVIANAVDANWNVVHTINDTVGITSSDPNASLPANANLSSGTQSFSVRFRTAGSRTLTATDVTDGTKTANTSPAIAVGLGAFVRLQILLPGETAAPGTVTGKTGSPTAQIAGTGYSVTVNAVDANYNLISTNDTVQISASDANAVLPVNAALAGGTGAFGLTNRTAGNWTITASDVTQPGITASTSSSVAVNPGAFTRLQLLVPGETAAAGTLTGKTGSASAQDTDATFNVTANAVDANWNVVPTIGDTVVITASDPNAALPANAALSSGTRTFTVRFRTAGIQTVTASDVTDGSKTASTSSAIPVNLGAFAQLQILLPGETAAPGTATGKTGSPMPQTAGAGYSVIVRAVDANYNLISTNDTVHFTSSDGNATLPGSAALSAGTGSFSLTNKSAGSQTVTVSDVTHPGIASATSAAVAIQPSAATQLVIGVAPAATATARIPFAPQPVILIQDAYGNVRSNDTLVVTATRSGGAGTLLGTTNVSAVGGVATFSDLAHSVANSITIQFSSGSLTPATSGSIAVVPGPFTQLQVLLPGETAAPGSAPGKTGGPSPQATGTGYSVAIRAVDADFNLINTNDVVHVTSSDPHAGLPSDSALLAGTASFTITNRTVGSWTVTGSDVTHPDIAPDTSATVAVGVGAFAKLQVLLPGETAAPGTTSGKTGGPVAQSAGTGYTVTVNAVDDNWNLINVSDTVQLSSSDVNASLPPSAALAGGTRTFSLTNKTAGSWTVTASDVTQPSILASTSTSFAVNPGAFTKLQLLVPGETAAPGTVTGKNGTPLAQNTDTSFHVVANAVDDNWNLVAAVGDTVSVTSSDANATLPADAALSGGTGTFSVKLNTSGNWTVTATDVTDGSKAANTSSAIPVNLGALARLQILLPGETAAPGTATGKTGTPTLQTAGTGYSVIVNAVDARYNLINTNDTVQIASSDSQAILPGNAALLAGTKTLIVTNRTAGGQTLSVSDLTQPSISSATSAAVVIQPALANQLVLGVSPSATATARVPFGQQPVILIEDAYGNLRSNDTLVVTAARSAGAGALLGTTNVTAIGGIATFSDLAHSYATNITIQFSSGSLTPATSGTITVAPGPFSQLQVLLPGETATPSVTPGKSGSPTGQATGVGYTVSVKAVDADYNLINVSDTVHLASSDPSAVLPADTALAGGMASLTVTNRTVGNWTFTASDVTQPGITPDTSSTIAVGVGTFVKLQLLLPGETAAPGTVSGKAGTPVAQSAGTGYTVTVNAVDANYNLISTNDTVQITSTDGNATLPANAALIGGTGSFNVTNKTAGNWTVTASDVTHPSIAASTSASFLVNPGAFTKLQLLVPGETAAPGTIAGKSGAAIAQSTDAAFNVIANAVDDHWNLVPGVGDTVAITASDANATLPPDAALSAGSATFNVKLNTAGNWTVTATDATDGGKLSSTSSAVPVNLGVFSQLQILLPGEVAAPGTPTGKTGTPTAQTAGTGYTVIVNAVDAKYNLIHTNDTVQVTSSDANATLPGNAALVDGTRSFAITNRTVGNWTVSAADVTHVGITPGTSATLAVGSGVFTKLQLLVPGETAAPGTLTGKVGTPSTQSPDVSFEVVVRAVDADWNPVSTAGDTLAITSSDPNATLPANGALSGGSASFSVKLNTAGSWTMTATDVTDGSKLASTSSAIPVSLGTFVKLQLLMPGETAAPGTVTGKTGAATPQVAGVGYSITVNAVDAKYNLIHTNDTVRIAASDTNAVLPPDAVMTGGTVTFSLTNTTAGSQSVTASNVTHPEIASDSGTTTVNPAAASKLAFTSLPVTVAAGVASAAITVQRQDPFGNPVTSEVARTVTLSGTSTGTVVFQPASLSITNGASSAEFTYSDTQAGTPTITAASLSPHAIASATQQETVGKATPIFSGLTASQTIIYGAASITLGGKLSAAGGVYPAAGEAVSVTINGNTQSTVINDSTGDFAFTYVPTNIPASAAPYTIGYSFAGDANLNAALDTSTTLTVNQASLSVAASDASRAYGQPNPAFAATFTGWVNGETTNVLGGVLVFSTTAETNSPVGTYPIIPGGLTSSNYTLNYSNGTLSVTSYALSVTASNQTRAYGAANPVLTGSLVGVQNGDNLTVVYTTAAGTNSPVGSYAIVPTLADPEGKLINYTVTTNNGTLNVTAAALSVAAHNLSRAYGATNPVLSGTITGIQNGDDITATYATVATNTSPVGTYAIIPTLVDPGSKLSNYSVSLTNGTLSVTAAALTVAANNAARTYGATNPVFSGTISGIQNGDNISATYASPALLSSPVGNYAIVPTLVDPASKLGNYAVSATNGTLNITAAGLSVVVSNAVRSYGATNPVFSGSITGIRNADNITAVYSSTASITSPVGGYPITPTLIDPDQKLGNYQVSSTNGTLEVTAAALTVTANNAARTYGATNPAFSGVIAGILNADNITATYASPATVASPVGTYPIVPSLVDPDGKRANYVVATNNAILTVTPAPVTITADPQSKLYGQADPALTYHATSGALFNGDSLSGALSRAVGENTGVYAILQGTLAAGTNYVLAFVGNQLTIAPTWLLAQANDQTRAYGATNPIFTIHYTGFVGADGVTNLSVLPQASTSAQANSPVGQYAIGVTGGTASNYAIVPLEGTLTVTQAVLAVAANNVTRAIGATNPVFTGTITGIQNGDNITATYATAATPTSPVGTYPIVPTLVDPANKLPNYAVISSNGTLTVTAPAPPVITSIVSSAGNTNVTITWNSISNSVYRVQYKTGLASPSWFNLAPDVTATGGVASFTDHPDAGAQRFYRVLFLSGATPLIPLQVTANSASRAYGATNPVLTGTITGVQSGDSITAVYTTTATQSSPVGTYAITPMLVDPDGKLDKYLVTISNSTLTVTTAGLVVTATNTSRAYGATNPVFGGTITGTQNGDNISATYACSASVSTPVGTYTITPTLVDPSGKLTNYTVTTHVGALTVTPAALTVTADPQSKSYGQADPVFTYRLTGGVLLNGDNLSGSLGRVVGENAGFYPILQGTLSASTNYVLTYVANQLTITPSWLTAQANNLSRPYGATNPVLTISYSGFIGTDGVTNLTTLPQASTTAQGSSPIGQYTISVTGGSASNYVIFPLNGKLTVTAAPLSVAASNALRAYGTTNPVFGGTITGLQNSDNISATYACAATTTSPVGGYAIVPTLVDPNGKLSNYSVSITNGNLNVTAATLTVAANNASRAYGATNPVFGGTITGLQNGDNITATYACAATTNSPVGLYPITPTLLDPNGKLGNYSVGTSNGTLTVTAAGLVVIANNAARAYGATNPVFSGTLAGVKNGDNITATYASIATTNSPVGSYPIVPTLIDPSGKLGNYSVATTNGNLNVTAATLNVAANNASRAYGVTNPAFGGTITGLKNGDNITAIYTCTATVASPVGAYPITPSLVDPAGKLANYVPSTNSGTLNVLAASLSVVANNASRAYGATNPVFGGTITGIQNGDTITATYASTATTNSVVGAYPITPTLVDPSGKLSNYAVATTNGTLSVTAAALTVAANNAARSYGTTNPVFSGTITGLKNGDGITASYACSATVTSPVGGYPIVPSLVDPTGKLSNYLVSTNPGTLSVTAAALTVTANNASRAYGAANPVFTGTIAGVKNGDNITATYATTATITSPVGTYPIVPTLVDPGSKLPNYAVTSSNGTLSVTAPAPVITSIVRSAGSTNVTITWTAISNSLYRVQYKNDLANSGWLNLVPDVTATNTTASFTDHPGLAPLRVYRVVLLVNSAPLIPLVVVANNASRPYGATNPVFSGTITGLQGGDNITATYSTTATASSPVGSYPITPTLSDPDGKLDKYLVTITNGVLTITKAPLTVTASSTSRAYGAVNPLFGGTVTGIKNGDNITATYASTATLSSPVGSYPIVPTLVDSSGKLVNYTVSSTNGTLSVTSAPLAVAANNATRGYGAPNPVFSGTITGIKNGDNITATYACAATPASPVGTYPIIPTVVDPNGKLVNYTVSTTNGALTVTLSDVLFFDDFALGTNTPPLSPWIIQSGSWTLAGGNLNGGLNPAQTYGYAYVGAGWTNYSVEARVQLPAGAYGGGVGGRLDPATGAHYAAWIFPEGSLGGSNVLKLIKFQNWTTFSFGGAAFEPMAQVRLAAVGTNWHALKLAFQGDAITVSLDGNQLISVTDSEPVRYASGGPSVDFWTSDTPYRMMVDDFLVTYLGSAQTPITVGIAGNGNGTATVTFAGTPGAQYVVQTTTNLATPTVWANIATNTAGSDGRWTFTNSTTTGPRRFYRSAKP